MKNTIYKLTLICGLSLLSIQSVNAADLVNNANFRYDYKAKIRPTTCTINNNVIFELGEFSVHDLPMEDAYLPVEKVMDIPIKCDYLKKIKIENVSTSLDGAHADGIHYKNYINGRDQSKGIIMALEIANNADLAQFTSFPPKSSVEYPLQDNTDITLSFKVKFKRDRTGTGPVTITPGQFTTKAQITLIQP